MDGTKEKTTILRARDLLLAVLILGVAAAVWLWPRGQAQTAVVEQDGRELARVELAAVTQGYAMEIAGEYPVTLWIEADGVRFASAACPDKLCVRTGKISRAGEAAVCLPARVSVRIEGGARPVDGVTG